MNMVPCQLERVGYVTECITCQSIERVANMNGMSCTSIAMMEWVNLNAMIDVLTGCTLIILYAFHDIMILCLHYCLVGFLRYLNSMNA